MSYKDLKPFSADFKAVYKAPNEETAQKELSELKEKWGKKYPYAISNWETNWDVIDAVSCYTKSDEEMEDAL